MAASEAATSLVLPPPVPESTKPAGLYGEDVPVPEIEFEEAPEGAPNVVVVLLDDVGFGAASTFGGSIPTPTLGALAEQGLSYNTFNTAGICSPTRAALLTGRNPHAANVGAVLNTPTNYHGYQGILRKSTASIAEILQQHGYSTSAWGKWHLTPAWETSPAGPFLRWPTRRGFDQFYGFLGGETNQFHPTLYRGTTLVIEQRGHDYTLTRDLATEAIEWIRMEHSLNPDRPFFVYFAPGATHAPLQVPDKWIERFEGRFQEGWDELRREIFQRQIKMGVIPPNTELTGRPDAIPAWESLSAKQQKVSSRLMQIYAAYLAYTDHQIGRLVSALKGVGEFRNTLFVYIVGDNGASMEGGPYGAMNYFGPMQNLGVSAEQILARLDDLGGPTTYPHYNAGWAWAMNTPFKWGKQVASYFGATRNAMVLTWPAGIEGEAGEMRTQFSYVTDIVPTILDAAGIPMPTVVNGVPQEPLDGTSLVYTFDNPDAETRHDTQIFHVYGHRAIYHNGWVAAAFHGRPPWVFVRGDTSYTNDPWELYHVAEDYSEAHDLAQEYPEKLRRLKRLFFAQAANNDVLPLHTITPRTQDLPSLTEGETEFTYYPGTFGIPESQAPNTRNRSHVMVARFSMPENGGQGVIATMGGSSAGWALYVNGQRQPVYVYKAFAAQTMRIVGDKPLPAGDVVITYRFEKKGEGPMAGGVGRLFVNGEPVGRGRLEHTVPGFFTIDETFDIGLDAGSAVAGSYKPPYRFTGEIEKVTIELK